MAHKLNISTRKSVKDSEAVSDMLTKLTKFASKIKKTLTLSALHRENRCSIHRQNFTRWSSSFTMLPTMLKSYKKNLFNGEHTCPIPQVLFKRV
jgi:ribosomal protein L30/L7E